MLTGEAKISEVLKHEPRIKVLHLFYFYFFIFWQKGKKYIAKYFLGENFVLWCTEKLPSR